MRAVSFARFKSPGAASAAALLLFCLGQGCLGADTARGFAVETLRSAGAVLSSPLRLDTRGAYWLGGLSAAGLLVYSYDGQIRHLAGRNKSSLNDDAASVAEKFGNGGYELGMVAIYGGLSGALGSPEGVRTAILSAESFLAANAAGTLVKYCAGRARPYAGEGKGRFTPFKFKTSATSFPSGHTTSAFAVASVMARRWESPAAGAAVYALASATALQRVYADKHWASDVLAGAALGTAVGRWIADPARGKSPGTAMLLPVFSPGYSGAAAVFSF